MLMLKMCPRGKVIGRYAPLKEVGNEKEGRSGKWQMIDIGLGPVVINVRLSLYSAAILY